MAKDTSPFNVGFEVDKLLRAAEENLRKATELAATHNYDFHWDGPEYGMGGYFHAGTTTDQWGDEKTDSWLASSQSC